MPSASGIDGSSVDLPDLSSGEVRQAPDGWHVLLRVRGVEHRFWLRESPIVGKPYAAELPLDQAFEARVHAARRLWRALSGRAAGPAFRPVPAQRCGRLVLAFRALDAKVEGSTYRTIAGVLFGADRIPERAWKTHDLRNRTIRLVQSGIALMRGGYRSLLWHTPRKR